jgi:hypothetical protein
MTRACPICHVTVGACLAVDSRPLPSDHIEREPLTVTPIFAALIGGRDE